MTRIGITGLGLVATGRRNILPGNEFDTLYSRNGLVGTNPFIGGEWSNTYDTLDRMAEIVRDTLIDTRKVASKLKGSTLDATLRNVWKHVYNHFQYKKDADGIEQIRRPARSWVDRKEGIDCDCMSVVISSLLHHLFIEHAFRKATYNEETGWQHVYIIVPKAGTSLSAFTGSKTVNRDNYYVLDCVVDKYDYEVPYIKKFDKTMKIQYLNGVDFSALSGGVTPRLYQAQEEDAINGLLGLGCEFNGLDGINESVELAPMFMAMLKQHLINTRKLLAINPTLTEGIYDPATFAQRLDYLIASFDEPTQREKALGELSLLEDSEELNGLSGGLGRGFFKKLAKGIKKVSLAPINLTKKITKKSFEVAKKVAKKAHEVTKKVTKAVIKAVVRFNPVSIAVRNGLLLAMKLNLFRIAEKLGYGYWTEEEATAKGLDLDEFKKAQKTLSKVQKIHKGLGGKLDKLEKAIKAGWKHGVKKHNLVHGLEGRGTKKARILQSRKGQTLRRKNSGATTGNIAQQKIHKAKAQASGRVRSTMPLLQLVSAQLAPVQYQSLLRKADTNELDQFYQAIRTNKNGIATKLSLAYKPVQEATRYDKNEYAKLLLRVRATEALVTKRGGTSQQLREAIDAGKQVAIDRSMGVVVAGSTAAASSVLAIIGKLLKVVNFVKLFKGKANSPHTDESEMKNTDVTADLDEDTQDEGDPNATVIPFKDLVDSVAPEVLKPAGNQTSVSSEQEGEEISASQLIQNSQPAANQAIAVRGKQNTGSNIPYATPGIVADQSPEYQDAQVVSSQINLPAKKDNTIKYIAIAGGIGVLGIGAWLLSRSAQKPQPVIVQPPAPTPSLSGVKTKRKSSPSTRKKVMTITV